jgi:hypothetical protein
VARRSPVAALTAGRGAHRRGRSAPADQLQRERIAPAATHSSTPLPPLQP